MKAMRENTLIRGGRGWVADKCAYDLNQDRGGGGERLSKAKTVKEVDAGREVVEEEEVLPPSVALQSGCSDLNGTRLSCQRSSYRKTSHDLVVKICH
jgi:hypothetical protein